ncbi:hypothetical protein GJ496_000632 [Pomphorhynchus laevis]|nr:hypothetical protein GJ496_000632 [Pomphorhynchus laevis]
MSKVYLVIRRLKTTYFIESSKESTVQSVKKQIEHITGVSTLNQRLTITKFNTELLDDNLLEDFNINSVTATPHQPMELALQIRSDTYGDFEPVQVTPYMTPQSIEESLPKE